MGETVLHVGVVRLLVLVSQVWLRQSQPGRAEVRWTGEAGAEGGQRSERQEAGRLRGEEASDQAGGVRGGGRGLRHQQLRRGGHLQGSGDGAHTQFLVMEMAEVLT